MRFLIKQKVFSWGDKFHIYEENGNEKYTVHGEVFSFGKKLHMDDNNGREVSYITEKVFSFKPKYFITLGNGEEIQVVREFSFFTPKYTVYGKGWNVQGNFSQHDYIIYDNCSTVAQISKEWMTWGDTYVINIDNKYDETEVLSVVLAIDACMESEQNRSSHITHHRF